MMGSMPSFADSAVIFVLALMLFGPKKLPQLARQLGKLMAEFRRASNEFRMQMEDELRVEEQKEHQKKVDAMAGPPSTLPDPEHPHLPPSVDAETADPAMEPDHGTLHDGTAPIAESGGLRMMPPSTGLPVESGYGTSSPDPVVIDGVEYPAALEHEVAEHTIHNPQGAAHGRGFGDGLDPTPLDDPGFHMLNAEFSTPEPPVGMSSEEPMAEVKPVSEQAHA